MKQYSIVIGIIIAQIQIIASDIPPSVYQSTKSDRINPRLVAFQAKIAHWAQHPTVLHPTDFPALAIHVNTPYTTESGRSCLVVSSKSTPDQYLTRVYIIDKESNQVQRKYFISEKTARQWVIDELKPGQYCSCCNVQ